MLDFEDELQLEVTEFQSMSVSLILAHPKPGSFNHVAADGFTDFKAELLPCLYSRPLPGRP